MLIQSIVSIAIAIASNIGLTNSLSNSNDEEDASSLSIKNVIIGIAFAAIVIIVVKFMVKLLHSNEEVKDTSIVKQSKKKKSKGKLKQKKVLKLEKGEISEVATKKEPIKLEAHIICERKEGLRIEKEELDVVNDNNGVIQEFINQDSIINEGWINVEKKKRSKKNKHLKQSRISAEDISSVENTGFSSIDQNFESTPFGRNVKESIVKEDKEKEGSGKLERSLLKTSEKLEIGTRCSTPCVSTSQKTLVRLLNIKCRSGKNNDPSMKNKNIVHVISKDAAVEKNNLEDQHLRQDARPKSSTDTVSYLGNAQEVLVELNNVELALEKYNIPIVSNNVENIMPKGAGVEGNDLEDQYLEQDTRLTTSAIPYVNDAQEILMKLNDVELASEKYNLPIVSNNVEHVMPKGAGVEGNDLEDQYLEQDTRRKSSTNAVSYFGNAQEVLVGLNNVELALEKYNIPIVSNNVENIMPKEAGVEGNNLERKCFKKGAKPKGAVFSSCMKFKKSGIVNVSSGRSNTLNKSARVGSGLSFKKYVKHNPSISYKEMSINYCSKLKEFRQLHFDYCIKLVNRIFKIQNNEVIISEDVYSLFVKLTPHKEILFFVLKVFLLMNLSALCGGSQVTDDLRYCATHFYDQSLVNLLVSGVIVNASKGEGKLGSMFQVFCKHVCCTSNYEPHSGKFFRMVFDVCCSLASVKLPEDEQELVDCAVFACAIYFGHMVGVLFRMLVHNHDVECVGEPFVDYLKAKYFCRQCHTLKAILTHMYHPTNAEDCPRNVANLIDIPSVLWKNCSKGIHDVVKDSISRNKMSFGVFVGDVIRPMKRLILNPRTRRVYREDIKTYENKIRTAVTLLPLPYTRVACSKEEKLEDSKSLCL
ncbi:DUF3514 domain-containing protein [Ehrlichia sp. JZT12]